MSSNHKGHAIILAAGQGRRFGAGASKGLVPIHGRPLLAWSLETFAGHPLVGEIVVVIPPGAEESERVTREVLRPLRLEGRVILASGGARRQDSSQHGIAALPEKLREDPATIVMIHDAARPLVSPFLITRCIRGLVDSPGSVGVLPALPVRETLKRVDADSWIVETVPRDRLMASQTPQVFRLGPLRDAQERAAIDGIEVTDDAGLLEAAGQRLRIVPGDLENLKVTYPEDRLLAERLLKERGQ
jgi:2-C-methyl-D-erythritol 4-phosphate cytidylyltransferase